MIELIEKLGLMIKEMLKLKLYPPYSLIILGILSRLFCIFDFVKDNKERLLINIEENINNIKLI